MIELLILADDYTGSMDTAVQFSRQGIDTLVCLADGSREVNLDTDVQVLIVDTESRHIPPDEAYARISTIVANARKCGVKRIYKKVDSTLRGNIGSELTAVLDASMCHKLIFLPAYPKMERTTSKGIHYVKEIPLAKSSYAEDPFNKIDTSVVAEIIGKQSSVPVRSLEKYESQSRQEREILVLDAQTDEDLYAAGFAMRENQELDLTAGCAGFAEHLVKLLDFKKKEASKKSLQPGNLLICGSLHENSRNQLRHAAKMCEYHLVQLTVDELLGVHQPEQMQKWKDILKNHGSIAMMGPGGRECVEATYEVAEKAGIKKEFVFQKISNTYGKLAKELLTEGQPGSLTVFGGDTLLGILKEMNCTEISPLDEIRSGVVFAMMESENFYGGLVTKAGGFGSEDLVQFIDEYLKKKVDSL